MNIFCSSNLFFPDQHPIAACRPSSCVIIDSPINCRNRSENLQYKLNLAVAVLFWKFGKSPASSTSAGFLAAAAFTTHWVFAWAAFQPKTPTNPGSPEALNARLPWLLWVSATASLSFYTNKVLGAWLLLRQLYHLLVIFDHSINYEKSVAKKVK